MELFSPIVKIRDKTSKLILLTPVLVIVIVLAPVVGSPSVLREDFNLIFFSELSGPHEPDCTVVINAL